jgi:hypothetical protein
MHSEVIHSRHSYPAVLLAKQLVDQRSVHPGPLVLRTDLLKNQRPRQIGDQPVSRFLSNITVGNGLYLLLSYEEQEVSLESLQGFITLSVLPT